MFNLEDLKVSPIFHSESSFYHCVILFSFGLVWFNNKRRAHFPTELIIICVMVPV